MREFIGVGIGIGIMILTLWAWSWTIQISCKTGEFFHLPVPELCEVKK